MRLAVLHVLGLLACTELARAADMDPALDTIKERNPEVPLAKTVYIFPTGLLDLWLDALARPETDGKVQAALAIAKAHPLGLPTKSAIAPLQKQLEQENLPTIARVALAQALITLDARDAAPTLWRWCATENEQYRNLVEPALARWNHAPARAEWLNRLDDGKRFTLVRTMQCLATAKESKAAPKLQTIVTAEGTPANIRLEAAKALGQLQATGLEEVAKTLASKGSTPFKLSAIALFQQHRGPATIAFLQAHALDAEPAVAGAALARLLDLDATAFPDLKKLLAHSDPNIRELTVAAIAKQAKPEFTALLQASSNDVHPRVRILARQTLVNYAAKPELRQQVLDAGFALLGGRDWRGQEQACHLFVYLKHQPAAASMLKLLPSTRGEVQIASAWALRKLADPATLPETLTFYRDRHKLLTGPSTPARQAIDGPAADFQLSQVIQFMGEHRYQAADKFLQPLIDPSAGTPKGNTNGVGLESRAAAVWALGMIHEGKVVAPLATKIEGRLAAVNPFDVEAEPVRHMCAIALGKMKATAQLATLERFYTDKRLTQNVVNNACAWAIAHINGTPLPVAGPMEVQLRQWFLVPNQ